MGELPNLRIQVEVKLEGKRFKYTSWNVWVKGMTPTSIGLGPRVLVYHVFQQHFYYVTKNIWTNKQPNENLLLETELVFHKQKWTTILATTLEEKLNIRLFRWSCWMYL